MSKYPDKFIYSGIEFNTENKVMEEIKEELQGRNFMAKNL